MDHNDVNRKGLKKQLLFSAIGFFGGITFMIIIVTFNQSVDTIFSLAGVLAGAGWLVGIVSAIILWRSAIKLYPNSVKSWFRIEIIIILGSLALTAIGIVVGALSALFHSG